MEIRPSVYIDRVDRRELFAWEMNFGGQGQVFLSGASLITAPSGYAFYSFNFLSASVLSAIGLYGQYNLATTYWTGAAFPANYTWMVPATSIQLNSGTGIGYLYKIDTDCGTCDKLAFTF